MTIIYQKRVYREDLIANRNVLYLFGDNLQRVGLGGQAAEMRGEPNAVGVATKKSPSEYMSDYDLEMNKRSITRDLQRAVDHHRSGGIVVIPLDGLGTGLARLEDVASKTFDFLQQCLNNF